MTEASIQNVLYRYFHLKRHPVTIPNCGACGVGKADLLSVTQARLVHEVEIKTSRTDDERDFAEKKFKHHALENQKGYRTANSFWFAVPNGLIDGAAVPDSAGLMSVDATGEVDPVVEAPRIPPKKLRDRDRRYIERGLTLRYWEERMRESATS
jgi:hypothetical protein